MSYDEYENAVLYTLLELLGQMAYDKHIDSRLSVVCIAIMDEFDRPGKDRPTVEECTGIVLAEFGLAG